MESGGSTAAVSLSSKSSKEKKGKNDGVKAEKGEQIGEKNLLGECCASLGKGSEKKLANLANKTSSSAGPSSKPTKFKAFKPPENWVDAPEFVPRWLAGK